MREAQGFCFYSLESNESKKLILESVVEEKKRKRNYVSMADCEPEMIIGNYKLQKNCLLLIWQFVAIVQKTKPVKC